MNPQVLTDFRKACLERLHECSYEEALYIEAALSFDVRFSVSSHGEILSYYIKQDYNALVTNWKLLREDKTECDETDQTEETLIALTNILR